MLKILHKIEVILPDEVKLMSQYYNRKAEVLFTRASFFVIQYLNMNIENVVYIFSVLFNRL